MRNLAAILLAIFCVMSVACVDGVMLQDSQQGEWSNFHDLSHNVSKDARTPAETHSEK
jgi:preprotein translocase subunit SecG